MKIDTDEAQKIDAILNRLIVVGDSYSPHIGESVGIYDMATERALLTKMSAMGFIDAMPHNALKGNGYRPNKVTAEIVGAVGILNYLENIKIEKQKLLDKSEVEEKLRIAQSENLRLNNIISTNAIKDIPIDKATKWIKLFQTVGGAMVGIVGAIGAESQWSVVTKLLAYLPK